MGLGEALSRLVFRELAAFLNSCLNVAAILPGISHCLVTKALAHQSLNPIIILHLGF